MGSILIVDDSSIMRSAIREILETAGYDVLGEAKSGDEAIDIVSKNKPDLVTLDITMRGKDGITTLKEIKQIDPKIKVIMVSAMGEEKYIKQSIELGANDFVIKPFEDERLLNAIKVALQSD